MNRRSTWLIGSLVGVVAVCALGALGYWALQNRERPTEPALSAQEARALIQQKNVGLGYLENQKLPEALAIFEQLAAKVPDDPLGPRNIAVARVVALGDNEEPADTALVEAARLALEAMRKQEGESVAWHWLSFREALAAGDGARALTHLDALQRETPKDAAVWYARFRVLRQQARSASPEALEELAKALELAPENAWLLVEWLRETGTKLLRDMQSLPRDAAQREAALAELKAKHARLPEQLEHARTSIQPFAPVIKLHNRVDVLQSLDQAIAAAQSGDLQLVAARMLMLANQLSPHAMADTQNVRWHPLEFVLDKFEANFYAATRAAEVEQPPAIEVRMLLFQGQVPEELQQKLGEIRDVALADFDLDGRLDVFALGARRLIVWSRQGGSGRWQERGFFEGEGFEHLVIQDLDADFDETMLATKKDDAKDKTAGAKPASHVCPSADVDVVLFGPSGVKLVENRYDAEAGRRTLEAIAADKLPDEQLSVLALTCADLEADGDLDLALSTTGGLRLWRNSGDWQFNDMSPATLPEKLGDAGQLVAFDVDRDIDIDLFAASPSGGGWLENLRHGQFRWREFAAEVPALKGVRDIEPLDLDGNAEWDLLAAGSERLQIVPLRQLKRKLAETDSQSPAPDFAADRLLVWDFDNDGWEDCLAWSETGLRLLRGLGDNRFVSTHAFSASPQGIKQATAGDLDADGDQDLALIANGELNLLENLGGNQNHWINVTLQAQQIKGDVHSASGRVSPYGVGSLLELKAGDRYQARVVQGQVTHFGLGRDEKADVIRVGWLNGVPQNIIQPAAKLHVCEQQVLGTSCPYLYAWNGERFDFVTDLLWNAPLGLQLAEGVLAPWRDWEYLKISGDQLQPKDGEYILQVTAELWEADYFDHVRLIAVDHPADVEIYSNEKVGGPDMAAYKIHTVRQPRPLVAAVSSAGRDLLPELSSANGVYAKPYERKLRQGVTEDHYMELELGNLEGAERVTLFLTGWVYPAATSINVALSQGGRIAPPVPPSLEMQDQSGNWVTVMPFMGFPGGKTKTIAVDLSRPPTPSGPDVRNDAARTFEETQVTRLRIRTTMEFYWDHIFYSVDESPAEVRTTELKLLSADLHDRGFSRVVRDETDGPEKFLYDEVSQTPKWPPMLGRFTRYGNVLQLLTERDDRLLVMGAGDETTLRFAAIPRPPPGWKRDFLLHSAGWDKDANLQTVLGQSSEPLPFEKMTGYPWPAGEPVPDSLEYRDYLKIYQTRYQSNSYWRAFLGRQDRETNSK